ncbi:MAG: response regulator transcription factor [Syntrophomonadaceae bacterium]|nr:response regulator transcription factor [Syntrophomonadaceae bacterium]
MRLVLIDDHPLVLHGIAALAQSQDDMEVVGTARSGDQGLALLAQQQPDIAVVDLRLPGEYGLDIIRQGRLAAPNCRFIILSSSGARAEVKQALGERVEGYVLKEALPEELLSAIRLVFKGRSYLDPVLMHSMIKVEESEPLEQLTPREMEVLKSLAQGMSNREIAAALFVTEYTVKKHVSQILEKLDLNDRTQAALYAFSKGLGKTGGYPVGL